MSEEGKKADTATTSATSVQTEARRREEQLNIEQKGAKRESGKDIRQD
jgi:hypothetical protein